MRRITALLAFSLSLPIRLGIALANAWSRLRSGQIPDYVQIDLGERVVERTVPRSFLWRQLDSSPAPQSLEELKRTLLAIANDPRPTGIVLRVDHTDLTLVRAQNLASLLAECRQVSVQRRGPNAALQIVCYLFHCNAPTYLVGVAADRIYLNPMAPWNLKGLLWSKHFLSRGLDRLGVEFDVVRAGRWKSATSSLTSEFMHDLERSHMTAIMDSYRQQITEAVAQGRDLPRSAVKTALARGPLLATEALALGLVDDVCTWMELPQRLAGTSKNPLQRITPAAEIRGLLRRSYRRKFWKAVGLIEVKGVIALGATSGPTLPGMEGRTCNHADLVQIIQKAQARHRQLAGVVLVVDSPGGSALASHIVLDALRALALKVPLAVYMAGVAASGGYYLAMSGEHVIAQEATLTGSIGVFSAKPVVSRLLQRLGVLTAELAQGENAQVYSAYARWTPVQRQVMQTQVDHIYTEFKQVVAEGRNMEAGRVEELAQGKVWTGRQALVHRLVDDTGPLSKAVQYIRDKAQVPPHLDVKVLDLGSRKKSPSLYSALAPAGLAQWLQWTTALTSNSSFKEETAPELWMLADDLV